MKLPQLKNADSYKGLYAVDFGDHSGIGFTAEEVAELLESVRFRDIKIYKIYSAYPDGTVELKGIPADIFQLEMGMFFYSAAETQAQQDYEGLVNIAVQTAPPGRSKVHLAKYADDKFVTALIYPAEYNEEFSGWLSEAGYKTPGPAEGGIEAVKRYYDADAQILQRHQLFSEPAIANRSGSELLAATKIAVQR
ncbi:MAG: hypothetical protein GWO86_04280 [Planctomycetes bacterium]|nr:hypothetical protein [Planctomycetota bacterium]